MTVREYRNAVESICWTDKQRQHMEALLAAEPVTAAPAMREKVSPAAEKPAVTAKPKKEKRPQREYSVHVYMAILAAALLAIAGSIASVAAWAKKQNKNENNLQLHLTDETIQPECGPLRMRGSHWVTYNGFDYSSVDSYGLWAESEQGWYYFKESYATQEEQDSQRYNGSWNRYTLCFKDKETGQEVPLCARPNCLHDTNTFCTATTRAYYPCDPVYYDGALYTVTTKFLNPDDADSETHQVLLRYAANGTSIDELCDFGSGKGAYSPIIHRGYIWCIVQKQNLGELTENPVTHSTQQFVSGGWQLWGYELATGKTVDLYESMYDPTLNHVNDAPLNFYAAGDALYFTTADGDWSTPHGLCRLSLITGALDVIAPIDSVMNVCITPEKILYSKRRTYKGEQLTEMHVYDLATGEDTTWEGDGYAGFSDGQYCFYVSGGTRISENQRYWALSVYDMEGNPVCTRDLDYIGSSDITRGGSNVQAAFVSDGKIYLHVSEYFVYHAPEDADESELPQDMYHWLLRSNQLCRKFYVCADIQDVIDGTEEWTELYAYHDDTAIYEELEGGADDAE